MHTEGGAPTHEASAASKICTNTVPTSRATHSSNTPDRKRPQPSAVTERDVTRLPSSVYSGRTSRPDVPQPASATGSDLRRRALHDRDELEVARPDLVPEVAVDLRARAPGSPVVDRAQDVDVDTLLRHQARGGEHPVVGRVAALVHAVPVVDVRRSVHREADQEPVLPEERAPVPRRSCAVGLDRVLDRLAGLPVALDQLDRAPEEVEAHERRLTALPGDRHRRRLVRLEQLLDVQLQEVVLHPEPRTRVERLLGQEEAVRAVEVAHGAGGLGEQVEAGRGSGGSRIGQPGAGAGPAPGARPGPPVRMPSRVCVRAGSTDRLTSFLGRDSPGLRGSALAVSPQPGEAGPDGGGL